MKTVMPFIFTFFVLIFLSCRHADTNTKCSDEYDRTLIMCAGMPSDKQDACRSGAAGRLIECDPEKYWKRWGCEDGKPCM